MGDLGHMKPLIVALVLLLHPTLCPAWGPTGHRVVGAIAEAHLTPKAKKAVASILGTESMAIAATWLDEVRSDTAYDFTRDWHWVTIPAEGGYANAEKNPNGDAIEAIARMVAALSDKSLSIDERKFHLKALIHLMGDLHQPLHVGKGDDRGGNSFQVKWFRRNSNLHKVWDEGLIESTLLSYTELAASLDHATPAEKKEWGKGSVTDWAEENVAFRAQIYPDGPGADLGYAYQYAQWPLVQQQLLKAGIRLAAVLNEVFK